MKKFIGMDLGGTNIKIGVVDLDTGTILDSTSIPTVARDGHDAVLERMSTLVLQMMERNHLQQNEVGGVGIGLPGVLNLAKGSTVFLPNLPGTWPNVPVRDVIQAKTGLPISILNDVRAITLGEWKFGAGRSVDTMACFAIGTGVGGGLVINGHLHLGLGGTSGELGHQTIDYNGPRCGCGNYGCLEAFASGPAIAALGLKAVVQGLTTDIGKLVNYDLNKITPDVIATAARQGDQVAQEIYSKVGNYYGIAIANILVSVGPRKVVMGGGVAAAGDLLFDPIRKTIRERAREIPVEEVEVVPAELGNNAGVMGLAQWAYTHEQGE
jgi:glucokinase